MNWFKKLKWWGKALVTLATLVWVALVSGAIAAAITNHYVDTSGWWQVAIELVGLPILIYGLLYELPRQIESARLVPKLMVGLDYPYRPVSYRESQLPTTVTVPDDNPKPTLVITNEGQAIAKYVKLKLEFDFADAHRNDATAVIEIPEESALEEVDSGDIVFSGGADQVIYPQDEIGLAFYLRNAFSPDRPPVPFSYRFHYKLWVDGVKNPVEGLLTVEVRKSPPEYYCS